MSLPTFLIITLFYYQITKERLTVVPIIKHNITTINRYVGGNQKKWIVIHNVGTKPTKEGSAYNNTVYFKSVNRKASAHYFIDDGDIIWQSVEDNDRSWSVGDAKSKNGATNNNTINIEVCGNSKFTDKELKNLKWLVQLLMKKYNIPASCICRHYDITSKKCPAYYVDDARWNELKKYITSDDSSIGDSDDSVSDNNVSVESLGKVDVTYRAKVDGKWLSPIINFNNKDYNGYAGLPHKPMTAVAIKASKGSIRYRVHVKDKGWYPWVTGYNINDFNNGYAGDGKNIIDGIQIYYMTPKGYGYQQAWYRSQTVKRKGWLDVACDDGTSVKGYKSYAGVFGEGMDRLQISIGSKNDFK